MTEKKNILDGVRVIDGGLAAEWYRTRPAHIRAVAAAAQLIAEG
jgi:hypothetical protein